MDTLKVLGLCGSLREGSYNEKLLRIAERAALETGAEVEEADLKALALPLYDQDIEDRGFPAPVLKLKRLIEACDVLLIACPEYNYSIPAPLKNAVDWASRGGNSFKGKAAALFGASTGPYGTVRSQAQLRLCLNAVNVLAVPQPQVFVSRAAEAFNADGTLKDGKTAARLGRLVRETLETARALSAGKTAAMP